MDSTVTSVSTESIDGHILFEIDDEIVARFSQGGGLFSAYRSQTAD